MCKVCRLWTLQEMCLAVPVGSSSFIHKIVGKPEGAGCDWALERLTFESKEQAAARIFETI